MAAAGYSLLTEIYYLSQILITCHMRATFDILVPNGAPKKPSRQKRLRASHQSSEKDRDMLLTGS